MLARLLTRESANASVPAAYSDRNATGRNGGNEHRVVKEIDGRPAAEGYARLLGVDARSLCPATLAGAPHGVDLVQNIEQAFDEICAAIGTPQLFIGFDCILRKAEEPAFRQDLAGPKHAKLQQNR
jgi:hypothetical protein